MSKSYLIALAIAFVIGGFVWEGIRGLFYPKPESEQIKPIVQIEYRDTSYSAHNVKPQFITKVVYDTVMQKDTLYLTNNVQYIAQADTAAEDSSYKVNISYVSDIPLSKNSFFDFNITTRNKIITKTVIQTEDVGFWYKRFIPYMGVGLSYDGKTVVPALQIGFGVRIN